MIKPGQLWREELSKALASARLAILLVSPDFLSSEFIKKNELPPLLGAAAQGGLTIFWIPLRPSFYNETAIEHYQAACSPDQPLSLLRPAQREQKLVEICWRLRDTLCTPEIRQSRNIEPVVQTPVKKTEQPKKPFGVPLGWTLCFIGENQYAQLIYLISDLREAHSSTGDGKKFVSGFSYWGPGPTIAWANACHDQLYVVMHRSIASFPDRWRDVSSALGDQLYHHVSLGIGTGEKDKSILQLLRQFGSQVFYVPIDMSLEMLSIGLGNIGNLVAPGQLRPVQIDFSSRRNVESLRNLLHDILGNAPILFSLLGNTIANFDEDVELLSTLATLVRPQDRFLLELAHTDSLEDAALRKAAIEYSSSPHFKHFATSALFQNTDIPINLESVHFMGEREDDRAIRIKVLYRNETGTKLTVMLPDRQIMTFNPDDTIRLFLSRKYKRDRIEELIQTCGFSVVKGNTSFFQDPPGPFQFGTDLLLLQKL
jgi:uncharacterized SAM-dependent methyltransferase